MAWLAIEGHDEVAAKFRNALARGKLGSTFLFVGPDGIGKRTFALQLAQTLLCQKRGESLLDPCGHCVGCAQVAAKSHPDLFFLSKPPGKSDIPVALIKGDDNFAVENSLLFNLWMRPFYGGRKVAIVDDADFLNITGANALLKTLEEPAPRSVLILLSTSADRQLPTIRSRAQTIRFQPLPHDLIAKLLLQQGVVASEPEAAKIASMSGGSLTRARELADPALWAFRVEMLKRLSQSPLLSTIQSQSTIKFVDEAGKEAPLRRARLRLIMGFAGEFYRQLTRRLSSLQVDGDADLIAAVDRADATGDWDIDRTVESADRCIEYISYLDRNANLNLLTESWLDDLLALNRPELARSR